MSDTMILTPKTDMFGDGPDAPPRGAARAKRGRGVTKPLRRLSKASASTLNSVRVAAVATFHTSTRTVKRGLTRVKSFLTSETFWNALTFVAFWAVGIGSTMVFFMGILALCMMVSPTTAGLIAYYIIAFSLILMQLTPLQLMVRVFGI